jgi:tetrahydromethanopterin S-methyltransferase subunit G
MSDEPDNLVVRYLRRLDEKVDRALDDLREIKQRLSSLEVSVAHVHGDFAAQSQRIDKLEHRLDRIGQRLDLRDA